MQAWQTPPHDTITLLLSCFICCSGRQRWWGLGDLWQYLDGAVLGRRRLHATLLSLRVFQGETTCQTHYILHYLCKLLAISKSRTVEGVSIAVHVSIPTPTGFHGALCSVPCYLDANTRFLDVLGAHISELRLHLSSLMKFVRRGVRIHRNKKENTLCRVI